VTQVSIIVKAMEIDETRVTSFVSRIDPMLTLVLALSLALFPVIGLAKTLVYCSEGSPIAFNPQITTDGTSNNAVANTIYNRLVEFEYGETKIIPALAESWTISPDGLTYTFSLRKNVSFHQTKDFKPTRFFNADDVLFSFQRMHNTEHPFHRVGQASYEYFQGMGLRDLIKDIKKIDEHTVEISLNRPEAPFLANMAMSFMSILSEEYASTLVKKSKPELIDQDPVGTGPFVLRRYRRDSQIRYDRHDAFWGGPVKIKQLVFVITPDASVRLQKMRAGECHVMIEPAPTDLASLKNDTQLKLLQAAGFNVGYLAMNTQKEPLNQQPVRQAIALAMNREAYIDAIYQGQAILAKNPLPPGIWAYHEKSPSLDYNPQKAKELLKKAGLSEGFDIELWTLPVTRPYNPAGRRMGEMMQADLAAVGIRARLISYDWGTYLSKSRNGEHALIQLGWTGDNGDPDNFLHTLLGCEAVNGGSNVARWCNQEFNTLVMDAKKMGEQQKRLPLYIKAQDIFKRELPWVPLAHATIFRVINSKVQGYQIHPIGGDQFRYAEIVD
jgi:dipeptide transport system substrate-binding protein